MYFNRTDHVVVAVLLSLQSLAQSVVTDQQLLPMISQQIDALKEWNLKQMAGYLMTETTQMTLSNYPSPPPI